MGFLFMVMQGTDQINSKPLLHFAPNAKQDKEFIDKPAGLWGTSRLNANMFTITKLTFYDRNIWQLAQSLDRPINRL